MEYLVTGGAGFIGSRLAELLLEHGSVTVIDDLSTGKRDNVPEDAFFEKRDVASAKLDFSSYDRVFHLAAFVSVPESFKHKEECERSNVQGTQRVVEACEKAECRLAYASTCAVYGDKPCVPSKETDVLAPSSPYAEAKLAGEQFVTEYANGVALRLFNVYGAGQKISGYASVVPAFLASAKQGKPFEIHGDGKQTRDFVFVDDACRAFILAAEKGRGVYNVGSGVETSVNELAETINRLTKQKLALKRDNKPRPGDVPRSRADASKAKKDLGFVPRCTLEDGLAKIIGEA
ncbi:MAG: NAD-dependent epimerase/dehydratase family protein [Candidatus Micrarchaeia archaeon]